MSNNWKLHNIVSLMVASNISIYSTTTAFPLILTISMSRSMPTLTQLHSINYDSNLSRNSLIDSCCIPTMLFRCKRVLVLLISISAH